MKIQKNKMLGGGGVDRTLSTTTTRNLKNKNANQSNSLQNETNISQTNFNNLKKDDDLKTKEVIEKSLCKKNKNKEERETARIATIDFARFNHANSGDKMKNTKDYLKNQNTDSKDKCLKQYTNILVAKMNNKQNFALFFSLIILFLSAIVLVIGFTTSQLFAQKTAIGSVTFDLESPSIALDNGLQLKYEGQVGENNTLSYVNDAGAVVDISNLTLNLSIPTQNLFNQYYVKLIYDFSNVNQGSISFGTNEYNLSNGKMSAMVSTGTTNEFYSISGESSSPSPLAKGITLNVFEFLKYFNYENAESVSNTFNFSIAIIVDTASSCQSTNRSQTIINGTINFPAQDPKLIVGSNLNSENFQAHLYSYIYWGTPSATAGFYWGYYSGNFPSDVTKNELPECYIQIDEDAYLKVVTEFEYTNMSITYNDEVNYKIGDTSYTMTFTGSRTSATDKTTLSITSNEKLGSGSIINFVDFFNYIYCSLQTSSVYVNFNMSFYLSDNNSFTNDADYEFSSKITYVANYLACISGDTKIDLGNGQYKLAQDIQIGDVVLSYDIENQKYVYSTVDNVISHYTGLMNKLKFNDGSELILSPNHPVLTSRGWSCCDSAYQEDHDDIIYPDVLEKEDLKVGDKVWTSEGWKTIEFIDVIAEKILVYNFTVSEYHNYFGNGILLHNSSTSS